MKNLWSSALRTGEPNYSGGASTRAKKLLQPSPKLVRDTNPLVICKPDIGEQGGGTGRARNLRKRGTSYLDSVLAISEKMLLALWPIKETVPTTMTTMTANITAYSAMSCPSSSHHM